MKKRILSLILCLVMVLSLVPIQAVAEEGSECANCSHYHYGDYVCEDCGLCSDECSNSDCWYETHCKNCGACYMKADNWCDECGWCQDCMDNEAHCKDCGRCFVGESKDDLCENCGLCSYHFDRGICSDCNLCDDCAGDEHCPYCQDDPNHLDGDEPCGACHDCAVDLGFHCEVCDACFEDGAERCPVHPDGNHCDDTTCTGFVCEECDRCYYEDGIEECDICGLCKDCCEEKSIDEGCYTGERCVEDDFYNPDHICPECNQCYHEFAKCADCDHCENCCFDDDVSCAEGCTCANTEPPTQAPHTHKFKPGVYTDRNKVDHAQKCLICKEIVATHHSFDAAGTCQECGYNSKKTLFFVIQPKNATAPVSWADAPETDPSHPNNNKVTFSATAVNQIGKDILSYEWYQVKRDKKDKIELDKKRVSLGIDNTAVSISVPADACIYSYEYYCVVTSRDADERVIQETSDIAMLRTKHNYGDDSTLVASDLYDLKKVKSISIITDDGVPYGPYAQGSEYHNKFCRGEECYHPQRSVGTRHNFVFERALGHGYNAKGAGRPEASREYFYSYLWKCSECGHLELRTSSTKLDNTTFEYQITFENTAGAYAEDGNKITRITAQPGETMYAIAPAKDADGNAFKEWKVVSPGGVTITSSPDGRGEFTMPASHIRLKAVYYTGTASEAATGIKIVEGYGFGYRDIDGALTMEVTDENKLYVKLTPDSLAPKMIVWDVLYYDSSTPQLIFMEESASATSKTTSEPVDSDHGVKIEAKAPGIVRLRATVQDSGGKVSDTITVKILPSPDMEETGHDKHTFDGGTTVPPTCTKSGYTEYKCTHPGCECLYRTYTKPLGHIDTNDDRICDRCNYQMGNDGNTSMVGLTKINKVEVNVTAPVCGFTPATAATPTGDDKDLYSVPTITWDPYVNDTETFFGNTSYTVLIKLEAKDGYGFKLNGIIDSNNTQFYINGNKATVVYRDAQEASISYTFPATERVHVHNYQWKSDADKHWRECFCGDIMEDPATHTESARITDTAAGIGTPGAWHTECEICYKQMNSGTIDALEKIDTAEVTVTAPVRRGKPEAATTKDSAEARYYVAATDWAPVVTNRFASGTKYTVKVTLEAKDGYAFQLDGLLGVGNTEFFINGKKATVVSGNAQQVIITYRFPATGSGSSGGSSGGTTTTQPVKSPGTGDPGVMLCAAMGLLSLTGGAWVVGKKRRSK